MNILFFVLKTKLLKNGEAPVLMRITINGDYDDVRIQRSVPLNLWNAAKGCSKGRDRASVALNAILLNCTHAPWKNTRNWYWNRP